MGDGVLELFEGHWHDSSDSVKMWLLSMVLLGFVSVGWGDGEGSCRVSESTLICVGRWDGISRDGVTKVVIREWDRRWCGAEIMKKAIIYGRGCTCESIGIRCKATPFSVNGKECQERVSLHLKFYKIILFHHSKKKKKKK